MKNLLALDDPIYRRYKFEGFRVRYSRLYKELTTNTHYIDDNHMRNLRRKL